MGNRHIEDLEDLIDSVEELPSDWFNILSKADDLDLILGELANEGNVSNGSIKRARIGLPTFSFFDAKWSELAPEFGLPKDVRVGLRLPRLPTPVYLLPPSFHSANFIPAWKTLDVYRGPSEQTSGIRFLDPYIVPVLATFHGRIIDSAEQRMVSTQYSSGSGVEHEVLMLDGVLFLVLETTYHPVFGENLAQLLLELLAAAQRNISSDIADLRVVGLLTDLTKFDFYSYDPSSKTFSVDQCFILDPRRQGQCYGMIHVTNKLFSLIFRSYIEALEASVRKSQERADKGDSVSPGHRDRIEQRELALKLAMDSLSIFLRPSQTLEDIENNGRDALEMLSQSTRAIPRFSWITDPNYDTSREELSKLANEEVTHWHLTKLENPHGAPLYLDSKSWARN